VKISKRYLIERYPHADIFTIENCGHLTALQIGVRYAEVLRYSFSASGSGIDYNGAPIDAQMAGEYNKQLNTLSGIFTLSFPDNPGDARKDSFSVKLEKDETEYIVMTKVVDNTGCVLEIKLKNNIITTGSKSSGFDGKDIPGVLVGNQ